MEIVTYLFVGLSLVSHLIAYAQKDKKKELGWQMDAIWKMLMAIAACLTAIAFENG